MGGLLGPVQTRPYHAKSAFSVKEKTFGDGFKLIVVGDSKQMPPSNFFNTSIEVEDNDEETGDVTDFESVAHTSISKQYLVFTIPQNH